MTDEVERRGMTILYRLIDAVQDQLTRWQVEEGEVVEE